MNLPEDISKLENIKSDLAYQIREIDVLLSNKNVVDRSGNRIKGHAYHSWRARRIREKLDLEKELLIVKRKIKEIKEKDLEDITGVNKNSDRDLLRALYKVTKQIIKDEEIKPDPEEQSLLDLIQGKFE